MHVVKGVPECSLLDHTHTPSLLTFCMWMRGETRNSIDAFLIDISFQMGNESSQMANRHQKDIMQVF